MSEATTTCAGDCDPGGNSEDYARHRTHRTCAECPHHHPAPEKHDWEPGDPDRMSGDPRCRICGEPKRSPVHH